MNTLSPPLLPLSSLPLPFVSPSLLSLFLPLSPQPRFFFLVLSLGLCLFWHFSLFCLYFFFSPLLILVSSLLFSSLFPSTSLSFPSLSLPYYHFLSLPSIPSFHPLSPPFYPPPLPSLLPTPSPLPSFYLPFAEFLIAWPTQPQPSEHTDTCNKPTPKAGGKGPEITPF